MVLVQKWPFSRLFFLGFMVQENVFYDIVERKNVFLGYKNKMFKRSKNWLFCKGVKPWFWSKNGDFWIFSFFANKGKRKCFLKYLKEKKPFYTNKTSLKKTTKINIFFKGVSPWSLSRNGDFLNLSFYAKWIKKKCFLNVLKEKKPF